MKKSKGLLTILSGLMLSVLLTAGLRLTARADGGEDYLDILNGGISAVLNPGAAGNREADAPQEQEEEETSYNRVMANVQSALNMRSEASEDSEIIGKLYKDCGGTILDRKDGWTLLQSGNAVGWAKDEYLFFDEEARQLAREVGNMVACMDDVLRVRKGPSKEDEVCGVLPKGDIEEVLEIREDGWIKIDYSGEDGYVSADYVTVDFVIDTAETMEEIEIREKKEEEARKAAELKKKKEAVSADKDTTRLLAALIQCEAGGESYEGKLAVGAVVMNRVRSAAYPNSVHGVIYASGQFTPAMSGKLDRVYASGNISSECLKAAEEALGGASNVGDYTHFRRNNGREGLVIGNHVFY